MYLVHRSVSGQSDCPYSHAFITVESQCDSSSSLHEHDERIVRCISVDIGQCTLPHQRLLLRRARVIPQTKEQQISNELARCVDQQ